MVSKGKGFEWTVCSMKRSLVSLHYAAFLDSRVACIPGNAKYTTGTAEAEERTLAFLCSAGI